MMFKKPKTLQLEQPWHGLIHIPPYLDCRAKVQRIRTPKPTRKETQQERSNVIDMPFQIISRG